jgi:hypothetical protein
VPLTSHDEIRSQRETIMKRDDQGTDSIFAKGLPGTGGDVLKRDEDGALRRDEDVEGHKLARGEDDGYRHIIRDGDGIVKRDDDVEGHRMARGEDGGLRREDEPDGLFRTGPSTQGEFTRRGPGENPHGDR